nr:TIM-barrel domain-containing protein [uncultured Acetatifactor sp.]
MKFQIRDNTIYFIRAGEWGKISACGKNCIRFQASPSGAVKEMNWTLLPGEAEAKAWLEGDKAILETGEMRCVLYENGRTEYFRKGRKILSEKCEMTFSTGIRNYRSKGSGLWSGRVTFEPVEGEHFYGLGHEATGCFDLKGCTIDLRHVNAKCTMPVVYSSLGYGFLWNMPSTGSCELACNRTRWNSDSMRQMDYVVMGGAPAEVAEALADLTGHAPRMPEYGLGFWQCKLRYETQEELLQVARRYKELGIPVDVIVIDYFHWTEQGDYKFDPKYWPDPKAMAEELHAMGIKLMVSMWPTINEKSENYREMLDRNLLIRTASGSNRVFDFYGPQAEIDPTNPETRAYVWSKLKENYIDQGVDCLWFDEAEPEIHPEHFDNLVLSMGNGDEVGLLYPYYYAKLVYDGMKADGREDIVTLSRCAYPGAQRFGTLVWSGDIPSTFESLADQVKSGLNMAMCGIPWWTTDIGGFYGGHIETEYFRELIVRWFQYGLFCPVMRLHGSRAGRDNTKAIIEPSGGDNEIWSFGEENFETIKELILLRERLRPYLRKHMDRASEKGIPVMRPMFFDFPEDEVCYGLGEQYMFGEDILFAPIVRQGERAKKVYLPEGNWILTRDREVYAGGEWAEVSAQLNEFIAFVREGSDVIDLF